ncbi:MAG: hypothetical protein ACLFMV_07145 [Spirochaetaceae bacterium]
MGRHELLSRPGVWSRHAPIKALRGVALLVAVVTLLLSCSRTVTMLADPVFAELYLQEDDARNRFEVAAREHGYRLRTQVIDSLSPESEELAAALRSATSGGPAVLTPLAARMVSEADLFPPEPSSEHEGPSDDNGVVDPREILLLAAPPTAETGHVSTASYDRITAFRRLGELLAREQDAEGERPVVLGYFRTDTPARRAELEAFERALGGRETAEGDAERGRRVTFDDPPSEEAVREELFRVRSSEADALAVFLGARNSLVLSEAAGTDSFGSRAVVTENLGPPGGWPEVVDYSVERDYADALGRFLSGERGEIRVEARPAVAPD